MIKKLAIAVLGLLAISQAHAGNIADVGCSLTTERGQKIGYGFQDAEGDIVIETTYLNRAGEAIVHPNNERPIWIIEDIAEGAVLTFKRDPQYKLLVTPVKPGQSLATLYKGRVKIAMGACYTEASLGDPS